MCGSEEASAYDEWHQDEGRPAPEEGAHPLIGEISGWDSSWTEALPRSDAIFSDADHLSRDDTGGPSGMRQNERSTCPG